MRFLGGITLGTVGRLGQQRQAFNTTDSSGVSRLEGVEEILAASAAGAHLGSMLSNAGRLTCSTICL